MSSFLRRLGLTLGLVGLPIAHAADASSPMQNSQKIDFVAHDPKTDDVVLSMVETRSWGDHGALLKDFQEKLNTYLGYVVSGQLAQDYPSMKDKKVTFLLQTTFPLGERENRFIEIVKQKYLTPRGISWSVRVLDSHEK